MFRDRARGAETFSEAGLPRGSGGGVARIAPSEKRPPAVTGAQGPRAVGEPCATEPSRPLHLSWAETAEPMG
jgi:hypothetical protein